MCVYLHDSCSMHWVMLPYVQATILQTEELIADWLGEEIYLPWQVSQAGLLLEDMTKTEMILRPLTNSWWGSPYFFLAMLPGPVLIGHDIDTLLFATSPLCWDANIAKSIRLWCYMSTSQHHQRHLQLRSFNCIIWMACQLRGQTSSFHGSKVPR